MDDAERSLVRLEERMQHLLNKLERVEKELENRVTIWRYRPTELFVWGAAAGAGTALLSMAISRIFGGGG